MEKIKEDKNIEYRHSDCILTKWVRDCDFQPTMHRHCDIEYYYVFDIDLKTVKAMAVNNWDEDMEIIQEYNLQDYYKKNSLDDADLAGYYEQRKEKQ